MQVPTYTSRGAVKAKPRQTAWDRGWDTEGEGSRLAPGREELQTNIQAREESREQNCPPQTSLMWTLV